ncbi:hypothetical protein JHK85_009854 [Glycine max]|uniref:Uncharacterized protein n=1 Tax=Glycine max TaxID=3847 RepID=A0A0R0K6P0_SOYBN|nr:hypothetical protein JHK85_009854 [Glycine max]KAG5065862.1 hypothetical protein JHK86_009593 [Glycine max]KAH1110758.1 hypothetical protein GYH30_009525 [Glycine max]
MHLLHLELALMDHEKVIDLLNLLFFSTPLTYNINLSNRRKINKKIKQLHDCDQLNKLTRIQQITQNKNETNRATDFFNLPYQKTYNK